MKISVRHRFIKKIPVLEVVMDELKLAPLPLVIYYHGWQSSKELVLTQARKLAKKGIRVLLPDAMNHGERRVGAISTIPAMTFWSSVQFNLAEFSQLTHFYQKQGLIQNEKNWCRWCFYGWDYYLCAFNATSRNSSSCMYHGNACSN